MTNDVGFEEVEHTADWALHIWGRNLAQLCLHAALGLRQLLVADVVPTAPTIKREVTIEAYDAESLLVNWLTELAYWAEMTGIVFHRFVFKEVTSTSLRATMWGAPVAALQKHVKAVTYHNLQIIHTARGLEATVVFDV
ncbi:MAG TPA: archease [Caldilineaceae bacterium]|nr:archease [Caldilineaceae bacterium]HRW08443.1 archease [Caldilineaceae bacterium]